MDILVLILLCLSFTIFELQGGILLILLLKLGFFLKGCIIFVRFYLLKEFIIYLLVFDFSERFNLYLQSAMTLSRALSSFIFCYDLEVHSWLYFSLISPRDYFGQSGGLFPELFYYIYS